MYTRCFFWGKISFALLVFFFAILGNALLLRWSQIMFAPGAGGVTLSLRSLSCMTQSAREWVPDSSSRSIHLSVRVTGDGRLIVGPMDLNWGHVVCGNRWVEQNRTLEEIRTQCPGVRTLPEVWPNGGGILYVDLEDSRRLDGLHDTLRAVCRLGHLRRSLGKEMDVVVLFFNSSDPNVKMAREQGLSVGCSGEWEPEESLVLLSDLHENDTLVLPEWRWSRAVADKCRAKKLRMVALRGPEGWKNSSFPLEAPLLDASYAMPAGLPCVQPACPGAPIVRSVMRSQMVGRQVALRCAIQELLRIARFLGLNVLPVRGSILGPARVGMHMPYDDDADMCLPSKRDRDRLVEWVRNNASQHRFRLHDGKWHPALIPQGKNGYYAFIDLFTCPEWLRKYDWESTEPLSMQGLQLRRMRQWKRYLNETYGSCWATDLRVANHSPLHINKVGQCHVTPRQLVEMCASVGCVRPNDDQYDCWATRE